MEKAFRIWYGVIVEKKEHALRGWNWGKAEFGKAELAFNVQNRPAFEIPYTEISNTNLAGKNEVAVEFSLAHEPQQNGVNGHSAVAKKGRKAAAGRDEMVEMRFYIPGTAMKKDKEEDGENQSADEDVEEQNAATLAGDTIATFLDILHLTPRYVNCQLDKETANASAEDDSILTCTKVRSDCAAKPTITRSNTSPSRSS